MKMLGRVPTKFSLARQSDKRGWWQRAWDSQLLEEIGMDSSVAQISVSFSTHEATLRGLHMLNCGWQETKTVLVASGKIQDVVVDMRDASQSRFSHTSEILEIGEGVAIPPGFAHGFLTLTPNVTLIYVMSQRYSEENDLGFAWDDPVFGINWKLTPKVISERDRRHAFLEEE